MEHVVEVREAGQAPLTVTLEPAAARQAAADFVIGVLGADAARDLPAGVTVAPDQWPRLQALKPRIFDRDAEGLFIRETIQFLIGGRELDPDAPLAPLFTSGRLVIDVETGAAPSGGGSPMAELGMLGLVHMLALGRALDVTRDYPAIANALAQAEDARLVTVDVARASYGLTDAGKSRHDQWMREAQDLVLRYDVYADVDEEPGTGAFRFDTGVGDDLRIAVYEHEGLDPFRVRFLLGLNDGEWDSLPDWPERFGDPDWFAEVFAPVEQAPAAADLGTARMGRLIAAGRAAVRDDDALKRR